MVTPEHLCWAVSAVPSLPGTGEPHTALSAAAVSPCPAGCALCNTSWDPIGLLGHRGTQLAHSQHSGHHWSTTGQPAVKHWSTIGQSLVNCWSVIGQPLVNCWSIIGQLLVDHCPPGHPGHAHTVSVDSSYWMKEGFRISSPSHSTVL